MAVGLGSGLQLLVVSSVMLMRGAAAAVAAGPVSIPPSQYWDGNDGPWSTFALQLGTPPQSLRLLPSTSGSSLWAVLPQGCTPSDPSDCPSRRGFIFKPNSSLTWADAGLFELPLIAEQPLGYTGNADYGFDNVTIGWQGYGGPSLDHQVVAGIATKGFSWLGMLGLTVHGTNFTDFNDPEPSLLTSLREKGVVPSSSWGYTAGAPYAPKGVYGSLTLGGYDSTRFLPNGMTFPFGADISWDLLVGVQDIIATGGDNGTDLLPNGIVALIDSTVPHIWLPVEACQRFEQAFGLVWDQNSDLYLVDETLHSKLQAEAPTVTFRLGVETTGGQTIDVVLPYKSFDLKVTLPGAKESVQYFPLRRAANESQYVLGRTFLQEAYVIVDYDRSNFSVSQAQFPDRTTSQKLVPILSPQNSSIIPLPQPSSSSRGRPLSSSAIAGLTIGALALITLPLLFFFHRRRLRRRRPPTSKPSTPTNCEKLELDASTIVRHEAPGWRLAREIEGSEVGGMVFELPAEKGERAELAASERREKGKDVVAVETPELAARSGGREKEEIVVNEAVELATRAGNREKPGTMEKAPLSEGKDPTVTPAVDLGGRPPRPREKITNHI